MGDTVSFRQKSAVRLWTFLRYRELFFQLISRDIKLKYRRSVLGYLWSVLNPLFTMVIMTVVFSAMLARGVVNFPVYLLIGSLLFSFMSGAVSRAIPSVTGGAALLKKIYIPKYIFTLSSVTSELVTMLFSLGALIMVIIATGVPLSWYFLLIPIPIIELYIFSLGLGLFFAQAFVFFRDIQYLWGVFSTAWMYLTPIFYPVAMLPERIRFVITTFNPLYFYISLFRAFVLGGDPAWPEYLWRGALAAGLMLLIGFVTFSRSKNKFVLYL
ncbi:MAG: ABC transporter permease [Treponema sp.]|jgi:lipopolysaccharide transport system permease protein|nr:ABC transporter permease [Treponema sp.]